jgi:L-ascorbate metabolism protein UlaG (beta-lactamase superfamily)/glycosyltransferase involved in cell wall biosynthesis
MKMSKSRIPINLLGQSGCKLVFPGATCYVDPFLSNSVQELDAPDLERLIPIPVLPESVTDANWVLITHEHMDHCDPHTLPKLAAASPEARFLAPQSVIDILRGWGIAAERLQCAEEQWTNLGPDLKVRAIPAAHPEITRDTEGHLLCVGYLLEYRDKRLYLSGDTFARQEIIDTLVAEGPIHTAFLPVNEHNFFCERRGIIGNMSVREAFQFAGEIGVKQVVAVHWDMFAANSVDPEEIRFIHQRLKPNFDLLIRPTMLNLSDARISIIIRTLNEEQHLGNLLDAIENQNTSGVEHEVIIVDSGSTDATLKIAQQHGCRILHISRVDFSFGRSLNMGCEAADGDILVIISGHCVPASIDWLANLCQPLLDGEASYTYGKQLGGEQSHYSEKRIFAKYFPDHAANGQREFFCNNANAAVRFTDWKQFRFDEDLTGLEDMELAKRLVQQGGKVAYVPDAAVYHYHEESWPQVQRRFEREAIALQRIMPQVHVGPFDLVRYVVSSTVKDWRCALSDGVFMRNALDIVRYRWHQYLGVYKGNNDHRRLSHADKEKYFYPS